MNPLEWIHLLLEYLRQAPAWVILAALIVLPMLGVPIAPLWLMLGALWGHSRAFVAGGVCSAASIALSFAVARNTLSPLAQALARRIRWTIPRAEAGEFTSLVLMIRLTPGIPFAVQNYVLSMAGVPFKTYFLISTPIIWVFLALFIFIGDSLFSGKWWTLVSAAFGLIAVSMAIRLVANRLSASYKPSINRSE